MRFILFIFVLFNIFGFSSEMEVYLKTRKNFYSVYILDSFKEDNLFDELHFNKVKEVLKKDLENSSYFYIDDKIKKSEITNKIDKNFLIKNRIQLVVFFEYLNGKIIVSLLDHFKGGFKNFFSFSLSKKLSEDRRKIHELADNILLKILRKKGISQSRILFSRRTKNPSQNNNLKWLSEIWISDYDGENKKQITFENAYTIQPIPIFSLKRKEIPDFLYVSYKTGTPKIYFYSEKKKEENNKSFISLRGNQLLPSISLNFDGVSFISDVSGRADLFFQRILNKKPYKKPIQLFSFPRATQASSSFSPDGKKLVFVSDKSGSPRIYLIKINKNDISCKRPVCKLLTIKNRENVTPSFSYDQKKIAYSAKTCGVRQIWIYDFEKKEEYQLTYGKKNKENPCWAEDNLHIVYNTEEKTFSNLYIIDLKRRLPLKITNKIEGRFPRWERSLNFQK